MDSHLPRPKRSGQQQADETPLFAGADVFALPVTPNADAAPTRADGPWFDVPAGTRQAQCGSCQAPIYWIETARGKRMPVDCDVDGGRRPFTGVPGDGERDGRGVSHFATCPNAEEHRRPR